MTYNVCMIEFAATVVLFAIAVWLREIYIQSDR